ncbi:MAG: HAD family hydrolase [Thermomicrobiales bacterium]
MTVLPLRAVIFDLDGLLVDSEPLAAKAMATFLASYGIAVNPATQRRMLGRRLSEAMAIAREAYALPAPLERLTEQYSEARKAALRGSVTAMPGAAEILRTLREAGIPIALATSGMRSHADISLAETGLAELFDVEVTGDDVTRGKPAPDLFLLTAERLGVEPSHAVVLEDSPLGVAAAIAAGMRVIAVQKSGDSMPRFDITPTWQVPTLDEARHVLIDQINVKSLE